MWPRPDPRSPEPVSEQIARSIRARIAAAAIGEGERLASVRNLAADLLVNPNTIAKVYRELEREGLLDSRPGSGVSIAKGAAARCRSIEVDRLRRQIASLIDQARQAGLDGRELEELIREAAECRLIPSGVTP